MNTARILPNLLLLGITLVLSACSGCTSGGASSGVHGQTRVAPPATERRPVYVQRSNATGDGVVPSSPTRFESDSTSQLAAPQSSQASRQAYQSGGWTPVVQKEQGMSVASQPGATEHTAHYPDLNDDSGLEDLDSLEPIEPQQKNRTVRPTSTGSTSENSTLEAPTLEAPTLEGVPQATHSAEPQDASRETQATKSQAASGEPQAAISAEPLPKVRHWMPTDTTQATPGQTSATSVSTSARSSGSRDGSDVPLKRTFFTHLFSSVNMEPEEPAIQQGIPSAIPEIPPCKSISTDDEEMNRVRAQIAAHFDDQPNEAVAVASNPGSVADVSNSAQGIQANRSTTQTASISPADISKAQNSGWKVLTPAPTHPAYGSDASQTAETISKTTANSAQAEQTNSSPALPNNAGVASTSQSASANQAVPAGQSDLGIDELDSLIQVP